MTSLQQSPAKGQQVPPPKMIDGVSEQQIDEAVKKHVREKKAARASAQAAPGREEVVIDAVMTYAERILRYLDGALKKDMEESKSQMAAIAWDALEVVKEEMQRLRDERPADFSWFCGRFSHVSSLLHCIAASYDMTNTFAARILADAPKKMDTLLALVETTEEVAA